MRAGARWLAGLLTLSGSGAGAEGVPGADFPSLKSARFGDVRVDMRPLLALGAGAQAEALRADLTEALRRRFGDRIGGTGPKLVVLIRGFSLHPYVGSENGGRSGFGGGGTPSDYLDGEALLIGRDGAVLGRHPQLTATPSSYGGAWYDPASERRRVAAIADIYADWLRRNLTVD